MNEKTGALDMTVKVHPVRDNKSLLATASVTIGGCFAVRGIQVRDGKNGVFVSMPQRKDAKGEYRDICFPTIAEMRQAINAAVLGEYERTAQKSHSRAEQTEKRDSVLGALRERRLSLARRTKALRAGIWRCGDAPCNLRIILLELS